MCSVTPQMAAGDWLTFVGIFVTVILGTVVAVSQTKSRTQKDFFIKEVDSLKSDYLEFASKIRSGSLSAPSIRDGLKNYSNRIFMISEFIDREYSSVNNSVFVNHGYFQTAVTDYDSISSQYNDTTVRLTRQEQTSLDTLLLTVHKSFIELIVSINKAGKKKPWLEDD